MFCKLNSYSLNGIEALPIEVEIDLHDGLPGFDIVGLPDCAVREAKERVKSAIKNSGYKFPICRITVNLAPADIKKEGSLYDLPIALGLLCCLGEFPSFALENRYFIGELALDGTLRGVRGLLPLLCEMPPDCECIIPTTNQTEGHLVPMLPIQLASHLKEVITYLQGTHTLPCCDKYSPSTSSPFHALDFIDVKGQDTAKRGLMLSAAGYHNAILIGAPGSGKTMLSKRLPSILPSLSEKECIEVTKIYSVAHLLTEGEIIKERPFRAPHHSISPLGLTGGGAHPKPGEMSLAHLGVLFLDELLEFNRHTLDLLRQPLEEQRIVLSRAQHTLTYPAHFLFIASTNPCPCGYYPDTRKCSCSLSSIKKYLSKLSGPLIDRIDIHLETHVPCMNEVSTFSHSSSEMRDKIAVAHEIQNNRYKSYPFQYNSEIPPVLIKDFCPMTSEAEILLNEWFTQATASMRAYDKIIRLSRTIADLESASKITVSHISEAIQYRLLDRHFWS